MGNKHQHRKQGKRKVDLDMAMAAQAAALFPEAAAIAAATPPSTPFVQKLEDTFVGLGMDGRVSATAKNIGRFLLVMSNEGDEGMPEGAWDMMCDTFGDDAVENAMKELADFGYVEKVHQNN